MTQHGWSLRWLIGGVYFIIMGVILGGLAIYVSNQVEADYMSRSLNQLRGQARIGADLLSPVLQANDSQGILRALRAIHLRTNPSARSSPRVALLSLDGKVMELEHGALAETPYNTTPSPSSLFDPEVIEARRDDLGEDIRINPTTGDRTVYLAVPVKVRIPLPATAPPDPHHRRPTSRWETRGTLLVSVPLTDAEETIAKLKAAIGFAFLAALGIVLVVNTVVSSYITKPLATLSEAAERLAGGKLDEPVPPSGAAEIASLGESFNRMARQLRLIISTLAEERAQAQAMLVSMADAVLVTDVTGEILLANPAAALLTNVTPSAMVGKGLPEVVFNYEVHDLLEQTLEAGVPLKQEIIFSRPTERYFEVHTAPVDLNGRTLGVVIVFYDITHERELAQMRRDFVANVSHELRTPVTSIRALAETMLDTGVDDPEMAREFLGTITSESERLTSLLDDLLHLARIESGRRLLNPEPIDLDELVHHITTRVIAPIAAKGQQLTLEVPAGLVITADRDALTQVLINLLDNARKYSPDGATITVQAELQHRQLVLRVSDTGFGIPLHEQERIFERFYRVDKARSRAQGGTGLGLAIVKHLVELHEGRIWVESEVGHGSTFTVVVPQREPQTPTPEAEGDLHSGTSLPVARQPRTQGG